MSINKDLQKLELSISSVYYGTNDYFTNYEVKQIIEHREYFENVFKDLSLEKICSIDDYYDYLFSQKIICFEEIIPQLLKVEHQSFFRQLIVKANASIAKVRQGDVIKFINFSYRTLLVDSKYTYGLIDVCDSTIDLIIQYLNGMSFDVKKYLCQQYGYIVIHRYDDFRLMIKKNPDFVDDLFPEYNLRSVLRYNRDDLYVVLENMYNSDSVLHDKVEKLIYGLSNDVKMLSETLDDENVLFHDQTIRSYVRFLRRIKHVDANKFEAIQKKLNILLEQSLIKHGHTFSVKIPMKEIKEMLKSNEPTFTKILQITHYVDKEALCWKCNLNRQPEKICPIIDEVSTNVMTNEYFTFSYQKTLDSIITVGGLTINCILSDKSIINDYFNGYFELINVFAIETNADMAELASDYELLTQMVGNVFFLPDNTDTLLVQSLCYGAAVYLSAFSEKLLRLCYFEEMKNDTYISVDKTSLGSLLTAQSIINILGEYQARNISYFLVHDRDGIVGLNYRNRLAHWNSISNNFLNPQLVCQLFYILTSILNSICLYYSKKKDN